MIQIREAKPSDFEWLADLMDNALNSFYDGDHRSHARRIFDAHIKGGQDKLGFFSFEQKMFVAEIEGQPAGFIHVVGKRQSTYKISPLIVDPEFRATQGVGKALLKYGENYARKQNARQMYCTVAEPNKLALQFFLKHDYVRAGRSDSHYKSGVTETMLYKALYSAKELCDLDHPHISVVPLEETNEKILAELRRLLKDRLSYSFDGIDDSWVDGLYAGYSRRHTADINAKYKLIYVALDSNGNVVGIVGATPKKGSPIKLMPFIANSKVAFDAMLIESVNHLREYGHKLYLHINPTAEEVMSLQRLGWRLDAALPNAYRIGIVTQQWSMDIGENTMRTLRIKRRFYDMILNGQKPIEVRVAYSGIKKIESGEIIKLVTHNAEKEVKVIEVRNYKNFSDLLQHEKWQEVAPDCKSEQEVLDLLRTIYPPHKEKLGVVVLSFK